MEFSPSGNNLLDVINWLKAGYFVCIHNSFHGGKTYCSKDSASKDEIIYLDVQNWPELLDDDEWPWYIKDAGFVKYADALPKTEHHFEIP